MAMSLCTRAALKVHDFSHFCILMQEARRRKQVAERSFFVPQAPKVRVWKNIMQRDDGKFEIRHEDQNFTEVVSPDAFLNGDWGAFIKAGRLWTFPV
jgi:hypothetical protein